MEIKPKLNHYDLTMIVVGLVIGMGIFRTPAEVASKAGTVEIFFAAWIIGAVVSLIGAMTFAEIGVRHPAAGGFYGIFSRCYHPAFAFMVNWIIVISNAVSTAAVAIMGAEYLAPLLLPGWGEFGVQVVSITAIVILYAINMTGFRLSAQMLNGLMAFKLLLILVIILVALAGFSLSHESTSHEIIVKQKEFSPWSAFFLCFIPVFFTYGGYQQTMNFGGDVVKPHKNIPKAVLIGIAIVMVAYLAANYAYTQVIGFERLKESSTLAADVVGAALGTYAHDVVSIMMFLSVMAYVTFFCLVIVLVLFFLTSFERILGFIMFFDSLSILAAAAAIFILRKREKPSELGDSSFRVLGYPWLPLLFIFVYGSVSLSVMYSDPQIYVVGLMLFILGYPLYHLMRLTLNKNKQ